MKVYYYLMVKIVKAFFTVWTYPMSKSEIQHKKVVESFGESETGIAQFFKSLEGLNRTPKYSFK
jgi:hypothetical protein